MWSFSASTTEPIDVIPVALILTEKRRIAEAQHGYCRHWLLTFAVRFLLLAVVDLLFICLVSLFFTFIDWLLA